MMEQAFSLLLRELSRRQPMPRWFSCSGPKWYLLTEGGWCQSLSYAWGRMIKWYPVSFWLVDAATIARRGRMGCTCPLVSFSRVVMIKGGNRRSSLSSCARLTDITLKSLCHGNEIRKHAAHREKLRGSRLFTSQHAVVFRSCCSVPQPLDRSK